jgi:hypothetical protein
MDNLQTLYTPFVPTNFSYPDGYFGDVGDVGCGCSDCGGLGDFETVNSKGLRIKCAGTKRKPGTCIVIGPAYQGTTRITEPRMPVNINTRDPYSPPIRPGVIDNDMPPRLPLPTAMQSPSPASATPQKQGFYDKSLDAFLTYNRNKNERDIALAQAGNAVGQNSQAQYPNNQYEPNQPNQPYGINPNAQVANAGAFAGEAAGSAVDGIVGFVSKNPLIVGLLAVGIFLFLKEPPKRGKA